MAINFVPNDPLSADPLGSTLVSISPLPDRTDGGSAVVVQNLPAEAEYGADTPDYVAWQAREASLRAIKAFEEAFGPVPGWRGESATRSLDLISVAGQDLNAYYDRDSISTFAYPVGGTIVYSGASTDVVAHETGHAILDAIRPDLWGVPMIEVGAFHEGFGDCIAVHTALSDVNIRTALLSQGTDLRRANFVESLAEQLSDAVRQGVSPKHNAAGPRHSFNSFQWAFPTSLPKNGPPGTLINEDHSLGQLASGVFYDLLCELFPGQGAQPTEASLKAASDTAMMLTARAIEQAPIRPRFFESWGRSMAVIDRQLLGGAHQDAIKKAFAAHGIAVGASNFLAPTTRLGARGKGKGILALTTQANKKLVRGALGIADSRRLAIRPLEFTKSAMAEIVAVRDVDLTGVDDRLDGVTASVPQAAIVGEIDHSTALLGAVDSGFTYDLEVRAYTAMLVERGRIDFGRSARPAAAYEVEAAEPAVALAEPLAESGGEAEVGAAYISNGNMTTHRIVVERGQRVLKRVTFNCGCGCGCSG